MRLLSTLTLFIFAAISAAAPIGTPHFGLISLRSGTVYQFQALGTKNSALAIFTGEDDFQLQGDLLFDVTANKFIILSNGVFVTSDTAGTGFSINDNNYLEYNLNGFYACPSGSDVQITDNCQDPNGSPVAISIVHPNAPLPAPPSTSTIIVTPTTTITTSTSTTTCVPVKFDVVAISPGTQFQNAPINKVFSHLHVFSVGGNEGTSITLTLLGDGTLRDQDGVGIFWDPNTGEFGDVDPWGVQKPTPGFYIENGWLNLNGESDWKACPSGDDKFSLANNDCTGGTPIGLAVVNERYTF